MVWVVPTLWVEPRSCVCVVYFLVSFWTVTCEVNYEWSSRSLGMSFGVQQSLRKVMKLKKIHPHWIKEKYTCCVNWLFCPEQKWFSVAKTLQKVMQYFCSGRWAKVQIIFGNFLMIFGAIKMRVALEHKFLKWVSEKKMNIFLSISLLKLISETSAPKQPSFLLLQNSCDNS